MVTWWIVAFLPSVWYSESTVTTVSFRNSALFIQAPCIWPVVRFTEPMNGLSVCVYMALSGYSTINTLVKIGLLPGCKFGWNVA